MRKTFLVVLALCVLAPLMTRADDDPEPQKVGPELRKLEGKWTVVRLMTKGREMKPTNTTYAFDGDKLTVEMNGRTTMVAKVKIDAKKKPPVLELTREGAKVTTKMGMKLDKG